MSLNVLERTHEIGIMRAIGASGGAVLQLARVESILAGFLPARYATRLTVRAVLAFEQKISSVSRASRKGDTADDVIHVIRAAMPR